MPSDVLLDIMFQQIMCRMPVSMYWMGEHFFSTLHGLPTVSTYKDICHHQYRNCIEEYGKPVVVFDVYESSNTKDMTHQRLSKGKFKGKVPTLVTYSVLYVKFVLRI